MAVRQDEAAAAGLEAKAFLGKPHFELFPALGRRDVLTHRRADDLIERHLAGAIPSAELATGQRVGPVRSLVAVELVVVAGDGAQRELAFLLAQRAFDSRVIVFRVPGAERLGVHAVDHEVHVGMLAVAMGDDQRLMLSDTEIVEQAVGDADHGRAIHAVVGIERERDVVDGPFDASGLGGGRTHDEARGVRVAGRKVARFDPRDAVGRVALAADLQISGESGKPAALHDFANHAVPLTCLRSAGQLVRGRVLLTRLCSCYEFVTQ